MSDTVIIAGFTSLTTILTVIITGIINNRNNKKQNIAIESKVGGIESKVDDYHKEVNGKMDEQLATTKQLGIRIGADKNQALTDAKPQEEK